MDQKQRIRAVVAVFVAAVLFCAISGLSIVSILHLQGNARVVNYIGIVRGASQRLVKREMQGVQSDALIESLDEIVDELLTGEGPHKLPVLPDDKYRALLEQVDGHWDGLKEAIHTYRTTGDAAPLFEGSETYFDLVNDTVFAAERYSEKQVRLSLTSLIALIAVVALLLLCALLYYVRAVSLQGRASRLRRLAYIDPLTGIPNRASCEEEIQRHENRPVATLLTVLMLDMNNLKTVNDRYGHQAGDEMIADFATLLAAEAKGYGFVGRYGGDEFLGLFDERDEADAERYLRAVNEAVVRYNAAQPKADRHLEFAAGYVAGTPSTAGIQGMIFEADSRMYQNKRGAHATRNQDHW